MKNEDDHLQSIKECPDCASENIVHSTMRDQVICKDCGLVFEPFTPVEVPAAVSPPVKPARMAKPKKARPGKAKMVQRPKPKKAKTRKAKARARPAKKARRKRKPAKKKWTWW